MASWAEWRKVAAGGATAATGLAALFCLCRRLHRGEARGVDAATEAARSPPREHHPAHTDVVELGGTQWELRAVLGQGAYGSVRAAHHKDQVRAVKLQPKKAVKLETASRALGLKHNNIVTTYAIYEIGEQVATVMDLAGCALDKQCELAPKETAKALASISSALRYMHGLRLVHGDVKPSNVAYDGSAYRILDCDNLLKLDERVLPSVSYPSIPPELAEVLATAWETQKVSGVYPSADWDVWMLGVMGAWLILGQWPDGMRELVEDVFDWSTSAEAREMAEQRGVSIAQVRTVAYCSYVAAGEGLPTPPVEAPAPLYRALEGSWAPEGQRVSAGDFGAAVADCALDIAVCRTRCSAPLVPLPEDAGE